MMSYNILLYCVFKYDLCHAVLTHLHKFTGETVEEAHELWTGEINFLS